MIKDKLIATTYEVLSCPFCGSKPVFQQLKGRPAVVCDNTLCMIDPHARAYTMEAAIKMWNVRAKPRVCYIDVYKTNNKTNDSNIAKE